LRQGFQRRIIEGKTNDLLSGSEQSNPDKMHVAGVGNKVGPEIEGFLLQMPPPTVFDFKESLRRPASAKIA